jgi:hypothetical protein
MASRVPQVTLTATFTTYKWPSDEAEAEFPFLNHGYCDPQNPWGTVPRTVDEETDWPEGWQEPRPVTLPVWQAAEFIRDFPGGVWDFREGEPSTICYAEGIDADVTLHVEGDGSAAALELADLLEV